MLYRNHHDKHDKKDVDVRFLDVEEDTIMEDVEDDNNDEMVVDYPIKTSCRCSECHSVFY